MHKNSAALFLAGICALTILFAPLEAHYAQAETVTDQDIAQEKAAVRDSATDTIGHYLRLVLYVIIERLEEQVENA